MSTFDSRFDDAIEPLRRKANGLLHMDALALLGFGPRLPEAVAELHERLVRA